MSLEPITQKFIDSLDGASPLYKLEAAAAHKVLTDLQSEPMPLQPADVVGHDVPGRADRLHQHPHRAAEGRDRTPPCAHVLPRGRMGAGGQDHARPTGARTRQRTPRRSRLRRLRELPDGEVSDAERAVVRVDGVRRPNMRTSSTSIRRASPSWATAWGAT